MADIKETAHRLETLGAKLTDSFNPHNGCDATASALVQELRMIEKDPKMVKAVESQLSRDQWKLNHLPNIYLHELPNNKISILIASESKAQVFVESSGYIHEDQPSALTEPSVQWVLKNFEKLDSNHDGVLSNIEMDSVTAPMRQSYYIPYKGKVIDSTTTGGIGYGYSMSNYGSFGTPSMGFHSTSSTEEIYGITKAQVAALIPATLNTDIHCK